MQQHAANFIARIGASTGPEPPRFIKGEFDALRECVILANWFRRPRCGECGHDQLLAISCKGRGVLALMAPGARRMSKTTQRVDHVIR